MKKLILMVATIALINSFGQVVHSTEEDWDADRQLSQETRVELVKELYRVTNIAKLHFAYFGRDELFNLRPDAYFLGMIQFSNKLTDLYRLINHPTKPGFRAVNIISKVMYEAFERATEAPNVSTDLVLQSAKNNAEHLFKSADKLLKYLSSANSEAEQQVSETQPTQIDVLRYNNYHIYPNRLRKAT